MGQKFKEDNKRIAKNTLILYFRMICTMVIGLYTSRVVLNVLGVTDFGVYNVVAGIITMFSFINGSMATSSSRFITYELGTGDENKLRKVFGQSLSIHVLIAVLIFILGETIGLWFVYEKIQLPVERFNAALIVYHLSIVSTMLTIISVPYSSLIIAYERMTAFAYMAILDVVFKLLIVYLLVYIPYDKLVVYAILIFITQLINQAIYLLYSWRNFKESKIGLYWDKKMFKEMSSFAGWSLFGNLAGTLFGQGLNILINLFFGPTVNAARGVAVQVQGAVTKFIANFQTALNPQITKTYAANDLISMHKLIYTSSKFSFFLMMFLSMPIFIKTEYILTLWLKIVPDYSIAFVRIILLVSISETLANPLIISAQATGKIKLYQQVVGGILLCILPVAYVVLKMGAPAYSVFIVHLIFAIIAQIARLYMIRPMINLSIRKYVKDVGVKVCIVFFTSLILSLLTDYLFIKETFLNFVLESLCCLIICILSIYYIGLDKSEKEFVLGKMILIKNKFL